MPPRIRRASFQFLASLLIAEGDNGHELVADRSAGLERLDFMGATHRAEDVGGKSARDERALAMPAQSCEASANPQVGVVKRSCDDLTGFGATCGGAAAIGRSPDDSVAPEEVPAAPTALANPEEATFVTDCDNSTLQSIFTETEATLSLEHPRQFRDFIEGLRAAHSRPSGQGWCGRAIVCT